MGLTQLKFKMYVLKYTYYKNRKILFPVYVAFEPKESHFLCTEKGLTPTSRRKSIPLFSPKYLPFCETELIRVLRFSHWLSPT